MSLLILPSVIFYFFLDSVLVK